MTNLDWYHYALLGFVVVAAVVFAYVGKMDVSVAFGIAGTGVGLAVPTSAAKPAAGKPLEVTPPAPPAA